MGASEEEIVMAEAQAQTEYVHIVCTPGVVGSEPRIAGHRIRVRDIVAARDLGGLTPEEIAASVYPELTLAEVYSALAYYEDHHDEIDWPTTKTTTMRLSGQLDANHSLSSGSSRPSRNWFETSDRPKANPC